MSGVSRAGDLLSAIRQMVAQTHKPGSAFAQVTGEAPHKHPGAQPLKQIHRTANAMPKLEVAALGPRIDDAGRDAKLHQHRQKKSGHYKLHGKSRLLRNG